jgi:4-hydroxythreonine-4-phosphate dehydrogenase
VPDTLTHTLVRDQLTLLNDALIHGWKLSSPRLALCALNPHASDGGLFGDEEATLLEPVVRELQAEGMAVEGPFPADTVFRRALDGRADAVAVPYHDVGMAVFKSLAFGTGVNVTLGLPFVRTSPDHGTAFDLAGKGVADASSAWAATALAQQLAEARR